MRLLAFGDLSGLSPDVCVVGAGPVGLAAASRLAAHGLNVLVLEAGEVGGGRSLPDPEDLLLGSWHAPLSLATAAGLGGTSRFWGGRCLPLDPVDLAARPGHPEWPITYPEASAHFDAAAEFLGCGPARFEDPGELPAVAEAGVRTVSLERWCDEPQTARRFRRAPLPDNVWLAASSTVTHAILDGSGKRFSGVNVRCDGQSASIHAPCFILSAGGVETTRLLLATQARNPQLFGGPDGPLGRYYMGHLSGSIADIIFDDPASAKLFRYRAEPASMVRRRLTFDPAVLTKRNLPNIGFYPDNPRLADASHGRGVLSALYLLLSTPGIGPRLLPEAIRQMQLRDASGLWPHLRNLALDSPNAAAVLGQLAWQRIARGRRKPSLFLPSGEGRHPLHYHAEHKPSAASRISMLCAPEAGQAARLRIDLRIERSDAEAVVAAHEALDDGLRRSGLARLVFKPPAAMRAQAVLDQAHDGYHQIGVARMGQDLSAAVVDCNGRAFGLDNLYVAGSAVFPSGGQANPTFFATALAFRLADHLAALAVRARSVAA